MSDGLLNRLEAAEDMRDYYKTRLAESQSAYLSAWTRLTKEERLHGYTMDQRDRAEEMADKLADALATLLGVEIGEHSSGNCPWQNALDAFEERATVNAPAVPTIKADGMVLKNGVEIIGDVHWHADIKQWRCLANVGGALCVIAVKVTPDSAPAVTEIKSCVHCASERISQLTFDVWECEDCGRDFTFDWKPADSAPTGESESHG